MLHKRLPPMNTLSAFESAARLGSFTRAAGELNITQAAISRRVKNLESWLGCALFERHRYTVKLNQAGKVFAQTALPALFQISMSAESVKSLVNSDRTLVIYADLSLAESLLIPRLSTFSDSYPDAEIKLITSSVPLENENTHVDIGLQSGRRAHERFESELLDEDEIYPICAVDYFKDKPLPHTVEDLVQHRLIHLLQNDRDWVGWREFCNYLGAHNSTFKIAVTLTTYTHVLDLAEAGQGVALGWHHAVEKRIKAGKLIGLTHFSMPAPQGLYIHYPKSSPCSQFTRPFIQWLKSEYQ